MKTPHEMLVIDLARLLKDAEEFSFHDFKSQSESPCPKMDLVARLKALSDDVKTGKYDNKADAEDKAEMRAVLVKDGWTDEMIAKFGL